LTIFRVSKEFDFGAVFKHMVDLYPVEYLWAWFKRDAMANYCPDNLSEFMLGAGKPAAMS
jgi:hypothetical protein